MGIKKTDALNAKKRFYAHMANADISAKNVGGGLIVSMGVSGTFASLAVGGPYVCMNARCIGAPFAVGYVLMAKEVVVVKFAL
jgi:hypothetical protein